MIVVDSNIIIYLLLPGPQTPAVERLRQTDPDWVAPRLWEDEFLNVLASCERRRMLSADQAIGLAADALELMTDRSFDVPPLRTLAVARRTGCSGYDSQYLALAEELGLKLLTFDRQLVAKGDGLALCPP